MIPGFPNGYAAVRCEFCGTNGPFCPGGGWHYMKCIEGQVARKEKELDVGKERSATVTSNA